MNKVFQKQGIVLMLLVAATYSCWQTAEDNVLQLKELPIENKLVPSIQMVNEPRYFNILERMNHYKVPGFSIAHISNGKIKDVRGYGNARKIEKIKVDANTVFQAGSISKPVTAVLVLKLRDKGILDLDVDVENYLKSWHLPESSLTKDQPVTLRLLLSHTAGINNFNSKGYPQGQELPTLNEVLNGKGNNEAASFDTIPGTTYKYSNIGYSIVQKVIEDATDKKFKNLAKELILEPLKMTNSNFETMVPSKATETYAFSYDSEGEVRQGKWHNIIRKSSGGLWSTPTDLAKFGIAIQQSLMTDDGLLSKSSAKDLVGGDHGLGLDLRGEGVSFDFSHSGRTAGFFSYMILFSRKGDGVVIMANSDNAGNLFRELLRGYSELNSWDILQPKRIETVVLPMEISSRYIGEYSCNYQDEIWRLAIKQNGEHLEMIDRDDNNYRYPIRALTETKLIDLQEGDELDFRNTETGLVSFLFNGKYEFIKQLN